MELVELTLCLVRVHPSRVYLFVNCSWRTTMKTFLLDDSGDVQIGTAAAIGLALLVLVALKTFWSGSIRPWIEEKMEKLI